MPENHEQEENEWLRVRYEKLVTDAMELLAAVPSQGKDDPVEELLARIEFLRDSHDVNY